MRAATRLKLTDLAPELQAFVADVAKGIRALIEKPSDLRVSLYQVHDRRGPGASIGFEVGSPDESQVVLFEFPGDRHMLVHGEGREIPVTSPAQVVEAMSGILYDDRLKGGLARAKARAAAVKAIVAELKLALRPWKNAIDVYPNATQGGFEVEILPKNPAGSFAGAAIQQAVDTVLQKHHGAIEKTDNESHDRGLFLFVTLKTDVRSG